MIAAVLAGDRRALARLLTAVENQRATADLAALYPHTGRAWVVGVTGAPGTGKSSLVAALASALRRRGQTVGILAVDPTSPFTGGAILGDRIRMGALAGDQGVFIRSMATRGSLGGLANTTRDAVRVLDAAGFDVILLETVGAGQSEVDVARVAQTVIVVEAPGLGDDIQAIKAGILEIADVLVVNKADHPNVENTVRGLRMMLELGHPVRRVWHHGQTMAVDDSPTKEDFWLPPVIKTIATEPRGIDDLLTALEKHQTYLRTSPNSAQRWQAQTAQEMRERLQAALITWAETAIPAATLHSVIQQVQNHQTSPQEGVEILLKAFKNAPL